MEEDGERTRLFIKIRRETLPRVSEKYPFIYLERGRLEIDDSSLKWLDADGNVIRIPCAILNSIMLGPGTSVTHEAIKVAASCNCSVLWVGEDSLLFYAAGISPTSDTHNLRRQAWLSSDPDMCLKVAKAMYARRFPDEILEGRGIPEMMGMEGRRVKKLYEEKAQQYGVGWKGREYVPGKFEMSDLTNQLLTSMNAALYGILCSCIHSLGYSPHLGFIHSGSPLPFVYDLADLYKADLSVDLAFSLTLKLAGKYNKYAVSEAFRKNVLEMKLLEQVPKDIESLIGEKVARRYSK